jgi:hypothetical protein
VTIAGMKAVVPSDPLRLGRRALVVAVASGTGGMLWVIGDAASTSHFAPLSPPAPPAASLVPAAWALTPAGWHGLAALPDRLGAMGLHWPGFLLALCLVAGAALAVIHPGAFLRPAPYQLPRSRTIIAYGSALLIGMALPATVLLLGSLVGPLSPFDLSGAMRVALGVIAFCAVLWTLAGQDIWHPRALVRFAHGGTAGFGIAATFFLAVLLLVPLAPVAEAGATATAIRDLGLASAGATWGTVLGWRLTVLGLGFALAGAVAVMAGPQSVGSRPRAGAAVTAAVLLVLLLLAGWGAKRAGARIAADLQPDVVAELTLTPGPPRTVALLTGNGRAAVARRVIGHDAETLRLYRECSAERSQHPAPSPENVERLASALAATGGSVSVRASRLIACLAGLRALRFEPEEASTILLGDSAPGRVPLATFGAAVRGVVERSGAPASRRWLAVLADSARFTGDPAVRERLARLLAEPAESTATVSGVLVADAPARWRVALVRGVAPGGQEDPALYAPITDAQVLQYMAAATTPDAAGRFTLGGVAPGTYQVALLVPDGVAAATITALSVRGEPGQFTLLAGSRRDLGPIRLNR